MIQYNHIKVQYRDKTEQECKGWDFDYPVLSDSGHKWEVPEILDAVWEQWNAGSERESEHFLKRGVRSMMIGDYVCVNGTWHEVLHFGWRINVPWAEVYDKVPRKDDPTAGLKDQADENGDITINLLDLYKNN